MTGTLERLGAPRQSAVEPDAPKGRLVWTRGLSLLVLSVVLVAPAGGLIHQSGQGQLMEDGFMILLPQRMLHGAVAYRDFDWLWGPAGVWVPALFHTALGWTESVSRLVGLAYTAGATFGTYLLVRRWSEGLGLAAGLVMALIDRASDLPEYAAISLGVLSLYFGYRSLIGRGPRVGRWAVLAGLAAGSALLFRPDRGIGAAVAVLIMFWGSPSRRRMAALGCSAGVVAFVVYALHAGLANTWDNVVGMAAQIPGDRYLDPPFTSWPDDLWMALVLVSLGVDFYSGARRTRISPGAARGPAMLGAAFFALTLLPEFVQRADPGHLLVAGSLAVALAPAALADLAEPAGSSRISPSASWRYGLVVLSVLGLAAWQEAVVPYGQEVGVTLGFRSAGTSTLTNHGHSFTFAAADAPVMKQLVAFVESHSRPGQTLFLGPGDLSRTPYADNSVAVLLPELRDAMHFPDMNPTVALDHGTLLARDVASADVVVLDRQVDQWNEANGSRISGSQLANQVVASDFCPAAELGLYEVLLRCAPKR